MQKDIAVIILAAGKGSRMKSDMPKALHPICGRQMIGYVLDLARGLKVKKTVIVLGHKLEQVRQILPFGTKVVMQKRLLGTADAIKQALPALAGFRGTVLILYADNPLLKKETIERLLKYHLENNLDVTLLTALVEKPQGYGRILRDKYSSISGIIEEKDADDFQKDIKEINTGIMCFKKEPLIFALKHIRPNNQKREFYLTDAIGILYLKGLLVDGVKIADVNEALGINSRQDLARANSIMQARINEEFMKGGVTIISPQATYIAYGTKIGQDTAIYPFTVIERDVKIGKRCSLGPFLHLREGSRIKDDVRLGNFLEVVRSEVSRHTLAKHFCYIGDSRIGRFVNIGAGTVTANFNGKDKNKTVIGDKAFIGSDTVLVAPVRVGESVKTGAGSVLVRGSVPAGSVVAGIPARVVRKTSRKGK
ncbi:MAG: NTP transferase domain-containing protein [Candidatus Omnitrophota bacterium]